VGEVSALLREMNLLSPRTQVKSVTNESLLFVDLSRTSV
jgi:hypothetical protein